MPLRYEVAFQIRRCFIEYILLFVRTTVFTNEWYVTSLKVLFCFELSVLIGKLVAIKWLNNEDGLVS